MCPACMVREAHQQSNDAIHGAHEWHIDEEARTATEKHDVMTRAAQGADRCCVRPPLSDNVLRIVAIAGSLLSFSLPTLCLFSHGCAWSYVVLVWGGFISVCCSSPRDRSRRRGRCCLLSP